MTLEEALCQYVDLFFNYHLFDDYMTNIALELMFYNENYQVGVIISLEFTVNNAGNVDKYHLANSFFASRYDTSYHRISNAERGLLIFMDTIYWIGLIWLTFTVFRRSYKIAYVYFRFKTFKIYLNDVVNTLIVTLSIICLVYRIILCKFLYKV